MATLEFTRRYAMAHRLLMAKSGKCAIPHGHNEFVTVRLEPVTPFRFSATNAAAPFEKIKRRWHNWIDEHVDHALHLAETDPLLGYFREREPQRLSQIMTFQGDPTTEALAACFWLKLSAFLADDGLPFSLAEVRIEETPTNTVALDRAVFDPADCGLRPGAWPWRADMSINDF
ncbi:MAG TPA: 6-carboxytetrahydropterin synthase [Vitreimonas sp.]|uniref:6-pyruvoyl trahydropterin synthase family protein n=1 Tax=Vitreimonas sp. TaxID=3069702 RepID=UPI002D4D903E|nr:6-carboxytetrahydropterin synthase [Vitreimonas sp.]HYD87217.1 6-carboxytetrahydropterin synthase [Vitreimonas sp.]